MALTGSSPLTAFRRLVSLARHCVSESRAVVQLVFLMRFLVGALCATAGGHRAPVAGVVLGAVAATCAVMTAYLLNGIMDVAEDRVNGSQRPISRGALSAGAATRAVWLLAATALVTASFVPGAIWYVSLSLFLGYAYSVPPLAAKRRTVTSAAVVITTGFASYLAGANAAGGTMPTGALLFCGVMALWMGFVGAVTKDLSDVSGDEVAGRRTLAVVHGSRAARQFAAVSAMVLGAAGLVAAVLDDQRMVLAGAVPLALGAGWVAVRCMRPSPDTARGPYRAFMVTQYAANGGLSVGVLAG